MELEEEITKKRKRQDPKNYWMQLKRLEKLNQRSEVKAGVIFSFHSLVIGLFADRIDFFKTLFEDHIILIVFVCLWLIMALISIYFCFKCFKPIIIKMKYSDNVFFFGDVVSKFNSIHEYVERTLDITADREELFVQLAEQMHVESTIVAVKFKNVQKSIKFFIFSIVCIVLLIVAVYTVI